MDKGQIKHEDSNTYGQEHRKPKNRTKEPDIEYKRTRGQETKEEQSQVGDFSPPLDVFVRGARRQENITR